MHENPHFGTLFVVATPIGNLEDMSARCITVLTNVDLVVAEDTRRSGTLLKTIGSAVRLESFHTHSSGAKAEKIVERLKGGNDVALVTDAGTPAVSDPGAVLVKIARGEGVPVVPIPGPSAVAAALSASGFSADRYVFLGFLPRKGKARKEILDAVADLKWTAVFFEAANRLVPTLSDLQAVLVEGRQAFVAREITKLYEDYRVGTPRELEVYYREDPPRGEITVVVEGGQGPSKAFDQAEIEERAEELLSAGATRKDVVVLLVKETGIARNEVYRIVTNL